MPKAPLLLCSIISSLTLLSSEVKAEDFLSRWSISGFGTIGGTGTDTNAIGYYRDTSQTQAATKSWLVSTDSRLGLQLDFNASETLHATVQWIARDHAGDFFEQNLEWAFLRWSPRSDIDIRAGRLGIDIYLLSDHRDVGYAYPWMRPPHEFYAYMAQSHFDGVDISKRYSLGSGYLNIKFFAGYSHSANTKSPTIVNAPNAGATIVYDARDWRAKISYAFQSLNDYFDEVMKNLPIDSSLSNDNVHFASAGAAYDDGVWLLQAEAAYMATDSLYAPNYTNAYLSIGRRFSNVTLFALYGFSHTFHNKVDTPQLAIPRSQRQAFQYSLDGFTGQNGTDEQSLSVGLRWDFYTNIAFKMQWSHFWLGTEKGASNWDTSPTEPIPYNVNVWSVGMDFIF